MGSERSCVLQPAKDLDISNEGFTIKHKFKKETHPDSHPAEYHLRAKYDNLKEEKKDA